MTLQRLKDIYRELFLALLFGAAEFLDGGKGGVGVERPQDVADIICVNLAVTFEVVDGEGEGCPYSNNNQVL